jgi:hypothetical protein
MIRILEFNSQQELGIFLFTTASRMALGVRRPGREVEHSPPSSVEVKMSGDNTSTPQYVFMA